jgi:hypothetical protein
VKHKVSLILSIDRYLPVYLAGLIIVCILGISLSGNVSAAPSINTKVRLHILTLECILENINNGVSQIQFLQPSDCKEKIKSVSPNPFIQPGNLSAIPFPQNGSLIVDSSQPQSSTSFKIEDLQIETGEGGAVVTERNLIAKIIILLFQITGFILLPFFLTYAVVKRLYALFLGRL